MLLSYLINIISVNHTEHLFAYSIDKVKYIHITVDIIQSNLYSRLALIFTVFMVFFR